MSDILAFHIVTVFAPNRRLLPRGDKGVIQQGKEISGYVLEAGDRVAVKRSSGDGMPVENLTVAQDFAAQVEKGREIGHGIMLSCNRGDVHKKRKRMNRFKRIAKYGKGGKPMCRDQTDYRRGTRLIFWNLSLQSGIRPHL